MTKQGIRLRIHPDGRIDAETLGFAGEACLSVVPVVEDLVASRTVASSYLPEFGLTPAVATQTSESAEDSVDDASPRYVTNEEIA